MEIRIATDFSKYPGPRNRHEGDHSAQEFLEDILLPRFRDALKNKHRLRVVLDGTAGYATSFLEGSFGELQRRVKSEGLRIMDVLDMVSDEEPYLLVEIKEYIEDAMAS